MALASLKYRSEQGELPGERDRLAAQFERSDMFQDSVEGLEFDMEITPTHLAWIYHCKLLREDFEIRIPREE